MIFVYLTRPLDAPPEHSKTAFTTVHSWWFELREELHKPGSLATMIWIDNHRTLQYKSPLRECTLHWSMFKQSQQLLEEEATTLLRSLLPNGMWFLVDCFSTTHTTGGLIFYATEDIFQDLMDLGLQEFWDQHSNSREENRTLFDCV